MRQPDGSYTTTDELFIEADPNALYKILLDFNHRHLWWKTNAGKLLNGEEAQEGSRVAITARQGLFPLHFLMRIQRLDQKERCIRLEVEEGPIRGSCEWQVEPRGRGAMVRLVWKGVRPNGFFATLLFARVGDRKHREHIAEGLAGLKRWVSRLDRNGPFIVSLK